LIKIYMSNTMPSTKAVEYRSDESREDVLRGVAWFCPNDQARPDETRTASFPLSKPVVGKYIVLRISPDPAMAASQQMQIKYIRFNGTLVPPTSSSITPQPQPSALERSAARNILNSINLRGTLSELYRITSRSPSTPSPLNSGSGPRLKKSQNSKSSNSTTSDEDELQVWVASTNSHQPAHDTHSIMRIVR
jgi:hypothetical protein